MILRLHHFGVEVEVLRTHRWRKGTDGLAGSAPKPGHHIDGEGQRHQSTHDAHHGHRLVHFAADFICLELQPSAEVGTQEGEDDNPQRQEHLAVEDMPAVCQIGYGEEL